MVRAEVETQQRIVEQRQQRVLVEAMAFRPLLRPGLQHEQGPPGQPRHVLASRPGHRRPVQKALLRRAVVRPGRRHTPQREQHGRQPAPPALGQACRRQPRHDLAQLRQRSVTLAVMGYRVVPGPGRQLQQALTGAHSDAARVTERAAQAGELTGTGHPENADRVAEVLCLQRPGLQLRMRAAHAAQQHRRATRVALEAFHLPAAALQATVFAATDVLHIYPVRASHFQIHHLPSPGAAGELLDGHVRHRQPESAQVGRRRLLGGPCSEHLRHLGRERLIAVLAAAPQGGQRMVVRRQRIEQRLRVHDGATPLFDNGCRKLLTGHTAVSNAQQPHALDARRIGLVPVWPRVESGRPIAGPGLQRRAQPGPGLGILWFFLYTPHRPGYRPGPTSLQLT
ncbi:hypothetical protein D3C71_1126260 [compost metagenome]